MYPLPRPHQPNTTPLPKINNWKAQLSMKLACVAGVLSVGSRDAEFVSKIKPLCVFELLSGSIWPSFIKIGEIACITPALSSGGLGLNLFLTLRHSLAFALANVIMLKKEIIFFLQTSCEPLFEAILKLFLNSSEVA